MSKKILEVKDLAISFKTDNGLVRAVRNINFELYEGETLCIVGESGSGKSVTSKAIMGILPGNAIVDGGTIEYEGENLLEISEEEYHKIRGHKIGMIFQDPLSSLNPIVKIGKQITEATLINSNKLKQMYDSLISEDLVAYKNLISKGKIRINNLKDKYNLSVSSIKKQLKDATVDESTKTTLRQQLVDLKKELDDNIAQIKAEVKEKAPTLKTKLSETKINAKAKVKQYKVDVKAEYKTKLEELNTWYASVQKADDTKEVQEANKNEYNSKLSTLKEDRINKLKITRKEAKRRALEIMKEVGIPLPEKRFKQYPFEFSGGMRQRIVIAIALTETPNILICDEPTTALDVTIQAQILELIKEIQKNRKLSCIFITHDLGVVANMADRVAVMYAGKIVEYGNVDEIFYNPKHPYTWALLSSIPDVDSKERLDAIPGTPPNMIYPPVGDAFALRSKYAMAIDYKYQPPYFKVSDTHYAATWLLAEGAPEVEPPRIVMDRIKNSVTNITKEDYERLSPSIKELVADKYGYKPKSTRGRKGASK